jgi:mannose-1-phosphate guanylyltransferase
MIKTAVLLAGGAGSRLYPLTSDRPKPMVKLLDKPIMEWAIEWLKHNGISNIVIGVAYHKEAVMEYFKDGSEFGVDIKYSVHSVEGETGEGFRLAISRYVKDELFVALNADELTNFRLSDMLRAHVSRHPVATIAVCHPKSPFGVINVGKNSYIQSFKEKPIISSLLVSIGIYLFSNQIVNYLPEKGSIEKTAFPALCKETLLRAYPIRGTWITVNTMKDLNNAESILKKRVRNGQWLKS